MRRSRLIKAAVFGAAFMFSAAAYAELSVYPFFYPMEKGEGVYYPPGTPVVKAQGQVEPVELGPFDPIFGPDTMTPRGGNLGVLWWKATGFRSASSVIIARRP